MLSLWHSWVIVAISRLISSIYLRFARRLRHHQRWLLPPLRPRHRGHMAHDCWWGGCSWITDLLCWSHVGSQWWSTSLSSIYQTEAILCHAGVCRYVSFEKEMFLWRRCRWKFLPYKFFFLTVVIWHLLQICELWEKPEKIALNLL